MKQKDNLLWISQERIPVSSVWCFSWWYVSWPRKMRALCLVCWAVQCLDDCRNPSDPPSLPEYHVHSLGSGNVFSHTTENPQKSTVLQHQLGDFFPASVRMEGSLIVKPITVVENTQPNALTLNASCNQGFESKLWR